MDWNKIRPGAKNGHLGHLFESQKVSESRIKELANAEKLEVAEITFQEAKAQGSEIVYARWLDDLARRMPEEADADRSRVTTRHRSTTPDHEDEVQATTTNHMRPGSY